MPATLEQILAATRATLPGLRARCGELERSAAAASAPGDFAAALRGDRVALIAEVKRRSPSAGVIRADLRPVEQARAYADAGAAAVSVLTDGPFFGGSVQDLADVAARVPLPVLRKDFILDEAQILEARAAGASAILLIVRAVRRERLRELLAFTRELRMEALVEIHGSGELAAALEAGARVIGVNSRDLDSFRVDVRSAWALLTAVPPNHVAVAESGMATRADVEQAAAAGADAVLIGTALSASATPDALARALTEVRRRGR